MTQLDTHLTPPCRNMLLILLIKDIHLSQRGNGEKFRILILSLLLAVLLFAGIESAFASYPLSTSVSPYSQYVGGPKWRAEWDHYIYSGDAPFDFSVNFGDSTGWHNYINQTYWYYKWVREFYVSGGWKYQTFITTDDTNDRVTRYTQVYVLK